MNFVLFRIFLPSKINNGFFTDLKEEFVNFEYILWSVEIKIKSLLDNAISRLSVNKTFFGNVLSTKIYGSWTVTSNFNFKNSLTTSYVGDNLESDILGANKLGITSVLVNRRKKIYINNQVKPNYEINNLKQILDLIS